MVNFNGVLNCTLFRVRESFKYTFSAAEYYKFSAFCKTHTPSVMNITLEYIFLGSIVV